MAFFLCRIDTRLGYFFTRNLDLSLGIQNLLDHRLASLKAQFIIEPSLAEPITPN